MKKTLKNIGLIGYILATSFLSCSKEKATPEIDTSPPNYSIKTGAGNFTYQDYKPLADKPVKVWYYHPGQNTAKVLILMHGNGRDGQAYFNAMKAYAEQYKFMLIVPEFTEALYNNRLYHRGGVLTSTGAIRSREDWTLSIIEPLFDYVKKNSGNKSEDYMLYGFSAGCQFVHRFMSFVPNNRVSHLVAASAGSYTMPDYTIDYPHGLKNVMSIASQQTLNKFYAKNTYIVVGSKDNDPNADDLPIAAEDYAQGQHRVERTENYFNRSKALASQQKVAFNWKYQVVSGVAHEQAKMAGPVAKLLFEMK